LLNQLVNVAILTLVPSPHLNFLFLKCAWLHKQLSIVLYVCLVLKVVFFRATWFIVSVSGGVVGRGPFPRVLYMVSQQTRVLLNWSFNEARGLWQRSVLAGNWGASGFLIHTGLTRLGSQVWMCICLISLITFVACLSLVTQESYFSTLIHLLALVMHFLQHRILLTSTLR
jgi:hypothetical protein